MSSTVAIPDEQERMAKFNTLYKQAKEQGFGNLYMGCTEVEAEDLAEVKAIVKHVKSLPESDLGFLISIAREGTSGYLNEEQTDYGRLGPFLPNDLTLEPPIVSEIIQGLLCTGVIREDEVFI